MRGQELRAGDSEGGVVGVGRQQPGMRGWCVVLLQGERGWH